jgi:integrase
VRLTDISVRSLNAPEKGQRIYFDDGFPSFGCRVSQGGTKSFVIQHGPNRQLITLGRYPVLSLKDARAIAHERLAEITLGRHRPKSIAWDDAVTQFLDDCAQHNRSRTVAGYRRLLERHFPFGRTRLADISYDDIARKIARLADTPGEQNHALVAVKILFAWAVRPPRRYVHHDPCQGLVRAPRPARERVLSDQELAAVFATATQGEDAFASIVALLLLTGQRRMEIGALKWSTIDEAAQTITLPGSATKNGRAHTFPYGRLGADVLQRIPRWEGNDYLFPASRTHVRGQPTTHFNAWAKAKLTFDARVRERYPVAHYQLHDLRRTAATGWARLGVAPHIVEKLLNHSFGTLINRTDGVVSAVAGVYNRHAYLEEMRAAVKVWEKHLGSLLKVKAPRKANDRLPGSCEPGDQDAISMTWIGG